MEERFVLELNESEEWPSIRVTSDSWMEITSITLWDDKEATFPLEKTFDVTAENLPLIKEGFRLDGPGAWAAMVTYGDKTSSAGVEVVEESDETAVVYNLQGVCVRKATTITDALETLPEGLYIVNGKKIIK